MHLEGYLSGPLPTGVLLDTNLQILEVVGLLDVRLIGRHKRTKEYTADDFTLLNDCLNRFSRRFTLPHVLTETSNLLSQIGEPLRTECLQSLAQDIAIIDEKFVSASKLTDDSAFTLFGVTDIAIKRIAEENILILSDDFQFCAHLALNDLPVINFNHIRGIS